MRIDGKVLSYCHRGKPTSLQASTSQAGTLSAQPFGPSCSASRLLSQSNVNVAVMKLRVFRNASDIEALRLAFCADHKILHDKCFRRSSGWATSTNIGETLGRKSRRSQ